MTFSNGRFFVLAGVVLAVTGLLVFSLAAPTATVGQETDVSPPGSLPETQTIDISADDTTPTVGQAVVVSVEVLDADGSAVVGRECTFSVVSQPGSDASVGAGPVTTDADGNAGTTLQVGSTAGTIEVEAQCGDLSATVSVVAGMQQGTDAAQPPASLPDSGNGGYLQSAGAARLLLMTLLAALGVTLVGASVIAGRHGRRVRGE